MFLFGARDTEEHTRTHMNIIYRYLQFKVLIYHFNKNKIKTREKEITQCYIF
jgi:hypothetical protein